MHKRTLSTVINSMDAVRGTLNVGTVAKWCSGLKKGGRQMEPYGNRGRKHNLSYENPLLPYFGGPVKTGTRGTGGGRSE